MPSNPNRWPPCPRLGPGPFALGLGPGGAALWLVVRRGHDGPADQPQRGGDRVSELTVRCVNDWCGRWAWLDGVMHALDGGRPYFALLAAVLLLPLLGGHRRARRRW